ncbi:MAG TPA: OmpA family protein, partial [Woeseiaceae bacterium]|nr:OmpA family protein [Woeseiaceae bacterium]
AACTSRELPPTGSSVADNLRLFVGDWDANEVAGLPKPKDPLRRKLFEEYVRLGSEERAEGDWEDTTFFLHRARLLSNGRYQEPQDPTERRLPLERAPEIKREYTRLSQLLASNRFWRRPEASAKAQASFECWMEESEEDAQPHDVDECRTNYLAAMRELEAERPVTRVILLPDLGGKVGTVEVSNSSGSTLVKESNASISVSRAGKAPKAGPVLSQAEIKQAFEDAINAQPAPPEEFMLYFAFDAADLTEESQAQIPLLAQAIGRHPSPEVDVIGYTDRSGTSAYNEQLSLSRANAIKRRLLAYGIEGDRIRLSAQGERDPLVPTPDGVAEPRNRRVQVKVR